MRVLFLSPRQAWPPVSGAKLREYHLARALAWQADITWIYFAESEAAPEPIEFCPSRIAVPKPKPYTPLKVATGLLSRSPLSVINYTSAGMKAAIADAAREHKFDLVHVDGIHLAGYHSHLAAVLPGVPVFYNWHNIESELLRRYAANTDSLPRRLYANLTADRLARVERGILATGAGHIVCSDRERRQLLDLAPAARIATIENGVDGAFFNELSISGQPRDSLVFIGSMSYHANVEAAVWFATRIWPGLHAQAPDLRCLLVGSNPTREVAALASIEGIQVTGTVDDVRPYYHRALAAVVPLRTGGGTRLKILEAMAAGVPVVATPLGAEGLDVQAGRHLLIARQEQDWAPALDSLRDPAAWNTLAAAARELVLHHYDWNVLGRRLLSTYQDWMLAHEPASPMLP